MSLTQFILPPQRDITDQLRRENEALKAQIRELNIALTREQERNIGLESGTGNLRTVLTPLYQALQLIFGDLDAMGVEAVQTSTPAPRNKALWDDWKHKLGGLPSRAIDALLMHGSMNRQQLRIHLKCANGSVTNVIAALNKAGLIDKNGNKVSLREL